jgi:hypothetical protein
VAFGNGGCRNGSGEFRNFLSDIASRGYLVVAIGPAGDAVVGGSEGWTGQTKASQLLDGVEWATKENNRPGSEYYQKLDASKVAVMGQSCGTGQATQVSGDPRVKTTVLMNGGSGPVRGGNRAGTPPAHTAAGAPSGGASQAPGTYGNAATPAIGAMFATLERMARRYAPYTTESNPPLSSFAAAPLSEPSFHGPVAFINGGPSDLAYNNAVAGFEALQNVPALLAFQDVGHYPATYRQPHGGAFALAVEAWLDWTLKGDQTASNMFVGSSCGLCKDPKWTVRIKNLP